MTEKAKVRFLDSCKSRRTFIHYLVFKKNHSKDVLDKKKLKWMLVISFCGLVSFSLFHDPEVKRERVEAMKVTLTPDFIEVPEAKKARNVKNSSKKLSKPLPGLKLVKRSEVVSSQEGEKKIYAYLLGASTDGTVRAKVSQSTELGQFFLENGAVLIGTAKTREERLYIEFYKVSNPHGESAKLKGKAIDPNDGGIGVKGSLSWSKAGKFLAKVGLDFTSGLAEGLKEKETAANGQVVNKTTVKNALLNGTSNAATETARGSLQKMQSAPANVSLPSGTPIYVLLEESK